ncbi:hypothetical protein L1887_49194 [Cichorium endivia]|nr:hypothetical protein L1887_49194 [Cichorium endivia]
MSGLLAFVLLVTGMGVGTLICGLIPLSLPLSHRMMRILEVFGAGLLVGAAVTVVIPEGANALFAHVTPASQPAVASAARAPVLATSLQPAYHPVGASPSVEQHQGESWAWSFITKRDEPPTGDHDHDHDHDKDSHGADKNNFTAADAGHRLGSSILIGIVLMYVIDQFTSGSGSSTETHDGSSHTHGGHHHHDYTATPQRPRLEAHRLSKSFHHKTEGGGAAARPLHKMSSKASFAIFDRADHGVAEDDEEARIGSASAPDASAHDDAHRRVDSIVTTSSSSDTDLPEDYDHHDASLYPNADFKRFNGSSTNVADLESPSAGAPLLRRQDTATSVASGPRPRSRRSRSVSSVRSVHTSFGQALTTIVGLLIHATADGIAMGASAQSGDSTLTMVVFIAIMVHKAPAAFGLCAMLMAQRLSRTSIRKAVAVFALAAPVGALLTYALLALFFDVDVAAVPERVAAQAEGIDGKSIGTALAFSGGTFLFVAFHAVLELAGADADTVNRTAHRRRLHPKIPSVAAHGSGRRAPSLARRLTEPVIVPHAFFIATLWDCHIRAGVQQVLELGLLARRLGVGAFPCVRLSASLGCRRLCLCLFVALRRLGFWLLDQHLLLLAGHEVGERRSEGDDGSRAHHLPYGAADRALGRTRQSQEPPDGTEPAVLGRWQPEDRRLAVPARHAERHHRCDDKHDRLEEHSKRRLGARHVGIGALQIRKPLVHPTPQLGPLGELVLRRRGCELLLGAIDLLAQRALRGQRTAVKHRCEDKP